MLMQPRQARRDLLTDRSGCSSQSSRSRQTRWCTRSRHSSSSSWQGRTASKVCRKQGTMHNAAQQFWWPGTRRVTASAAAGQALLTAAAVAQLPALSRAAAAAAAAAGAEGCAKAATGAAAAAMAAAAPAAAATAAPLSSSQPSSQARAAPRVCCRFGAHPPPQVSSGSPQNSGFRAFVKGPSVSTFLLELPCSPWLHGIGASTGPTAISGFC